MGKAISSLGCALLVYAYVIATSDVSKDEDKVYYVKKTINGTDVYVVDTEDEQTLANLYEICSSTTASAIHAWVQPICLTDVPDIGGTPSRIETTTLCDKQKTYIQGIEDAGESLDFTANYVHNAFVAMKTNLVGTLPIKVVFGGISTATIEGTTQLSGKQGCAYFNGEVNVSIGSFGVDEVVPMTISITISSEVKYA